MPVAPAASSWPFGSLRMFGYDMIFADPPWRFHLWSKKGEAKSPQAHYETMTLDAIRALPVGQLARGDALLWLWATHPMIKVQIEILEAWGFRFATSGVWVKRSRRGMLAFGPGYRLRCSSEPFLIGIVGSPETSRSVRTVIEGPLREHSRKPDEAYGAAERLKPDAFRCDLFSRESRPGWDCWGLEAGKFDQHKEKAA